jgi:hypothetical protein
MRAFDGTPSTDNGNQSRPPAWASNSTVATSAYGANGPSSGAAYGSHLGLEPFLLGGTNTSTANTFSNNTTGWLVPNGGIPSTGSSATTGTNGAISGGDYYSSFLGAFSNGSKSNGQDTWTNLNLLGYGAEIYFTLDRLDQWSSANSTVANSNPQFQVYIDNQLGFAHALSSAVANSAATTGKFSNNNSPYYYSYAILPRPDYGNHYGNASVAEQTYDVVINVPVGVTSLQLGFGSTLNSNAGSYGIDNFLVLPASQLPSLTAPTSSSTPLDYIASTASLTNPTPFSSSNQTVGSFGNGSSANGSIAAAGYATASGEQSFTDTTTHLKSTAKQRQQRRKGFLLLLVADSQRGVLESGSLVETNGSKLEKHIDVELFHGHRKLEHVGKVRRNTLTGLLVKHKLLNRVQLSDDRSLFAGPTNTWNTNSLVHRRKTLSRKCEAGQFGPTYTSAELSQSR